MKGSGTFGASWSRHRCERAATPSHDALLVVLVYTARTSHIYYAPWDGPPPHCRFQEGERQQLQEKGQDLRQELGQGQKRAHRQEALVLRSTSSWRRLSSCNHCRQGAPKARGTGSVRGLVPTGMASEPQRDSPIVPRFLPSQQATKAQPAIALKPSH